MNPMQYPIYKGTGGKFGAAQFNFQNSHFYKGKQKDFNGTEAFEVVDGRRKLKDGWKERQGGVFVEVAPTVDKNTYDWQQKVIMALSINDLGKLLYFLKTGKSSNKNEREKEGRPTNSVVIMHDPNAKKDGAGATQKYLKLYSPNGTSEGCMLTVVQVENKKKKFEHSVPLSGDELVVLATLFQSAISKALNW
jgi:hypothetical protein